MRLWRNEFVRDGALVFAATMLVNVFNYGIHFVLSRKIGVAEYGAFAALLNAQMIFSLPSAVLSMVVVKFVAEFVAVGDRARTRILSERALLTAAAVGMLICLASLIFGGQIAAYLQIKSVLAVQVTALSLAVALVGAIARAVLQGAQDFKRYAVSAVLEGAGKFGLAVALAFAGFGIAGAFAGYAIASAIAALYSLWAVRSHWSPASSDLRLDFRRMGQTMGAAMIATAAITVMGFIDVPLVKHFFEPAQAGLYGAVSLCGRMIFFLVAFIPSVILPKVSARATQGESASTLLLQALGLTALLAGGVLAAFYLFPGAIVRITYGASFVGASHYIFLYGLAMMLLAGVSVVTTYKIGMHRFDFVWVLIAVLAAEIVGISLLHRTLMDVVVVLLCGNAVALAGSSLRLEPRRVPARASELPDVA